ncbi:uncharacterized protein LOC131649281 [Vicia villosa]|uniref:uncharacterized protein LOC131649281 n=1 Tax=Vicia villosa TaxID=3911 RepID=UPI00273B92F8|nr:uncharacterized protein LOC131649281 [Vicia villosa]
MIIGSLNVRGGGSLLKRRRISSIITRGKADIFVIQETKISSMEEVMAKSFWRKDYIEYSYSNSVGRSGGMITLWKGDSVTVLNSFSGEGYLGIKALWQGDVYYVINIYSSCEFQKKVFLRRTLLDLKGKFVDGEWTLCGDFNAIKNSRERIGRSMNENVNEMKAFGDFINNCNLVDVPYKGKRLSSYSGDGLSMSRLDRFLISDCTVNKWGIVGQSIGERDVSDHCPVWIVKDNVDWGPKPFKVNNEWFNFKSFLPFVEKTWKEAVVEGRSDFVLKEKFRILKGRLKWWNKEVFGRIDLEIEEEVSELNRWDSLLKEALDEERENIVKVRKEVCSRFWLNLRIKENMVTQKSRLTWLNGGDSNSRYFHKVMEERRRYNHIGPIISSSGLLESVSEVKDEVFSHFSSKFVESERSRPRLEAVSKLLAGRLKRVLDSIISPNQSAFVPGRQLLDGVLISNEVADYAPKEEKSCILFKVDFEKAYDKVNWDFLRFLLKEMGFGTIWMRWMELLIFQSKMSVLVNGSPTKEFVVEKGLRQGDPLSPFLFVLVAEGLTALVKKATSLGNYEGFLINGKCWVDILQFADDTLLIEEGNWKQIWAIKTVLKAFELVSGLGTNYRKSKLIGINISDNLMEAASSLLSCKVEGKVFSFLGILVGANPRRISTWNPLLDKIKKRLSSWKNRFLNFAGRITLIKSILCSLSIFTMSFYRMPARIVRIITKLQSDFLWGASENSRKIHFVGWKKLCLPFNKGGVGFKRMDDFSFALLNKWRWRILHGSDSFWLNILRATYGDILLKVSSGGDFISSGSSCSTWWKDISSLGKNVSKDAIAIIVPFWLETVSPLLFGIPNGCRGLEFSVLTGSAPSSFGSVYIHAQGAGMVLDSGPNTTDTTGFDSVEGLYRVLAGAILRDTGGNDVVKWEAEKDSMFSVKSCYLFYADSFIPHGPYEKHDGAYSLIWKTNTPFKTKVFGWRILINRLPTKELLLKRGISFTTSSSNCVFCGIALESLEHVFFKCSIVKLIWRKIAE